SQLMESVRSAIRLGAQTDLNVLIVGETGSGKEIAARMVHDYSSRHKAPFVPVNCAAIPKDLFESELFGYERGAFTGAVQAKKGLMDECHGGTLFLDEVGDLSPENQARLLRVIESHRFRRLGGNREQEVDFRIVSATNRPLARAITENAFRSDLYYRLNGIEIGMPALRDRKSDIPELAEHFLALVRLRAKRPLKGFGPGALEALQDRELEGNVRELRSIIERAAAVSSGEYIEAEDLAGTPLQYGHQNFPTLAELERQHLLEALQRTQGNMAEAARLLGIGRTTLYEKLARYDLRAR
ncbi:MAG: sigma-54 dependent transcriptional regulator, partial [Candidatus Hydrogenedentes bacterium]|nr:sigma-54 dependent transcriptional regulator [Candidatus Hydrogenedentota bacterium]